MSQIKVEKLDKKALEALDVFSWPIWEKEVSSFPWEYDERERCLFLEGQVTVTPKDGSPAVSFGAGDFVTFSQGLACTWKVSKPVRKHYNFG